MQLDDWFDLLDEVKARGNYYMAECPAHEDSTASLQFSEREDGSWGLYCHAGCSIDEICSALEIPVSALMAEQEEKVYTYLDEGKRPLFRVHRKPGKEFPVERAVGSTWEWGMGDTRRVLYHLPEILASDPNRWVFVVEGEKDVDAIWDAGGIATCNPGGAEKWDESFSEALSGRYVTIVQDKDDAGRRHAALVMLSLRGKVKEMRLVEARKGKDTSDHLAANYALADFIEPSHFRPLDFSRPAPQVDWVWETFLASGDLVLIAASAGLGKSFLTMGLSVATANGFGEFLGLPLKTGKVLYFDEENPEDVVYSRLNKLGHKNYDNLRFIWANGVRLDTHPERLIQEALIYQPKLIVIDSLARVHAKEENSFFEMAEILNGTLKPLARETGAAVVLIHHHDATGRRARGSSDIEAAVDCVVDLFGTPGSGQFILKTKKSRRAVSGKGMFIKIVDLPGVGTRLEGSHLD